jgi:hypothetical protein
MRHAGGSTQHLGSQGSQLHGCVQQQQQQEEEKEEEDEEMPDAGGGGDTDEFGAPAGGAGMEDTGAELEPQAQAELVAAAAGAGTSTPKRPQPGQSDPAAEPPSKFRRVGGGDHVTVSGGAGMAGGTDDQGHSQAQPQQQPPPPPPPAPAIAPPAAPEDPQMLLPPALQQQPPDSPASIIAPLLPLLDPANTAAAAVDRYEALQAVLGHMKAVLQAAGVTPAGVVRARAAFNALDRGRQAEFAMCSLDSALTFAAAQEAREAGVQVLTGLGLDPSQFGL